MNTYKTAEIAKPGRKRFMRYTTGKNCGIINQAVRGRARAGAGGEVRAAVLGGPAVGNSHHALSGMSGVKPGLQKQGRRDHVNLAAHGPLRETLLSQNTLGLRRREAFVGKFQRKSAGFTYF